MIWRISGLAAILTLMAGAGWAEPKVGDRFGDWVFGCNAQSETAVRCNLSQAIVNPETKQPVARFTITAPNAEGQGRLTALLPLGINFRAGLAARVDEGEPVPLGLVTCIQRGCMFEAALTSDLAAQMRAGSKFTISFALMRAQGRLRVSSSLTGVTDAFNETGWY